MFVHLYITYIYGTSTVTNIKAYLARRHKVGSSLELAGVRHFVKVN